MCKLLIFQLMNLFSSIILLNFESAVYSYKENNLTYNLMLMYEIGV